ncbi:MAG: 50S ribosomal protein L7ae [Clostridiales bacterium]|nr:50S ribosomal protein L7ae [Clostridiales bacterium]
MTDGQVVGLLGLAMRAGQVLPGAGRALELIRQGQAGLVLMDEASSDNTRKRFGDACAHHQTECLMLPSGVLGEAIGRYGTMVAAMRPGGITEKLRGASARNDRSSTEQSICGG